MKILVLNPPNKHNEPIGRDLIYGCWCHGKRVADIQLPPLNLMYIASVLKNYEVVLVDALSRKWNIEETLEKLDTDFDVLIIASSNTTFLDDVEFSEKLKEKNSKLKIIFCGPHTTVYPKKALRKKIIDIGVQGETEETIKELIEVLDKNGDLSEVKGISYRENDEVKVNIGRGMIENLDSLPFPDWEMIDRDEYFNPLAKKEPIATILSSRGCIGRCTFCTSPSFYGKNYRFRSAENVLEELEMLYKKGFKEVLFRDETFTVSKERTRKICEGLIEKGIELSWMCNIRIGSVDKETMELMKKAGCHNLWVGVESGVQEILDIAKKDIKIEKIEETFKWANEVKINTHAHFMFGMEGESLESLNETIKFIKKINPTTIDIGITTPFPGTELFDKIKDKADIGDGTQWGIDKVHNNAFFNEYFCDVKSEDLEKAIFRAYKEFYLRPGYMLNTLMKVRSFNEFFNVLKAGWSTVLFSMKK
ncbi:B12-binding domain-containing radical SAM protein [archaeon]|nr:B12-binding domain-containing radical SAM protein [archaeon]